MPFEVQEHKHQETVIPSAQLMTVLQEWIETGADLIEALGSPPKLTQAFERFQKALLAK